MASIRDKLVMLMGKKLDISGGRHIGSPRFQGHYEEIIEVGEDYFVVQSVRNGTNLLGHPITYAISVVEAIEGGL